MKKYMSALTCFIFLVALYACVNAFDFLNRYPWDKADAWHCKEIDVTIQFSYDENGEFTKANVSEFIWDEKVYVLDVFFQANAIVFTSDVNGDGLKEGIIDGTWHYEGDTLVIQVKKSLLDSFYSDLVFVPRSCN